MARTVTIDGREYEMRYTLRALFIYESLAGRPFDGRTLSDMYLLCYSTLLACNPEIFNMSFSEFIDFCDNDSTVFKEFSMVLADRAKIEGQKPGASKKKAKISL